MSATATVETTAVEINRIIESKRIESSGGSRNLFYRAAGTEVQVHNAPNFNYIQRENAYVIQWEGNPEYDSGYSEYIFKTLNEARACFNSFE